MNVVIGFDFGVICDLIFFCFLVVLLLFVVGKVYLYYVSNWGVWSGKEFWLVLGVTRGFWLFK